MSKDKLLQWFNKKFIAEQGVVVGADRNQEWMLNFWFEHYTDHNDYPVCFADFGMSPQMVDWCKERGTVIDMRFKVARTWFKKPVAILHSPFKRMVWIDSDCEVKRNLAPIFEYCDGFGTTIDPYRTNIKGYDGKKITRPVTSGVIATHNGNDLVLEWASACLSPRIETKVRGDQEALNMLLSMGKNNVQIMPHHYQSLRMDMHTKEGISQEAVLVHWTGQKGKEKIKEKMLDRKLFG